MATLERRLQSVNGKVTYRVRWWADGRQRSKSFDNYDDARRFRAVVSGDLVNGSYINPKSGTVTLASFVCENLPTLTIDVRPSTRARIESIVKTHLLPEFGYLPISGITAAGVQAWVSKQLLSHGPATVRKNCHVLRRVLDLAVAHGILRANVAALVRLPAEPKHEQRYLSQDEALRLADSIAPRMRLMVMVAVFGGLRFGELCALTRGNVNPVRNTVAVRQTLVEVGSEISFGPPKTKGSVRVVTLPRSIMAALVEHMDRYTKSDVDALVFTGEKGQPIRRTWFYRYYYQPATVRAGLEGLRFHDLRHTFVALWVSLGRNAKEVSRAAGHSSVSFTLDRYGHLYETDHDGLADALDGLLRASDGLSEPPESKPDQLPGHTDDRDVS